MMTFVMKFSREFSFRDHHNDYYNIYFIIRVQNRKEKNTIPLTALKDRKEKYLKSRLKAAKERSLVEAREKKTCENGNRVDSFGTDVSPAVVYWQISSHVIQNSYCCCGSFQPP